MSFFEPPPPPPAPPVGHRTPAWLGPPENELGVAVPVRELLVRTDELAIALIGVVAFSNGIELQVELRRRREPEQPDPLHLHMHARHARTAEIAPEVLRFGVQFADGRKATNLAGFPYPHDEEPKAPLLLERGGGGGGRCWSFRYWLWPLPPPGPLSLVVEWPSEGVELTSVEVDAQPLLDAAAHADALWPEEPGGGPGLSVRTA